MKKYLLFVLIFVCVLSFGTVFADEENSVVFDNGDGTYSLENGFFLRQYDNYGKDAQLYLSALDACSAIIADYSPVIDPYVYGEKDFDDEQWYVIREDMRRMSAISCSYVIQEPVPEELAEYENDIFGAAYHFMIANELMANAIETGDEVAGQLAYLYYAYAQKCLDWWE